MSSEKGRLEMRKRYFIISVFTVVVLVVGLIFMNRSEPEDSYETVFKCIEEGIKGAFYYEKMGFIVVTVGVQPDPNVPYWKSEPKRFNINPDDFPRILEDLKERDILLHEVTVPERAWFGRVKGYPEMSIEEIEEEVEPIIRSFKRARLRQILILIFACIALPVLMNWAFKPSVKSK